MSCFAQQWICICDSLLLSETHASASDGKESTLHADHLQKLADDSLHPVALKVLGHLSHT